jgi:arylsulfatase A-like enzyme
MEGVLSLPHHVLLNSYPNTRMRSISEILRDAGYYTEVLIGSDPYFDNGMVWFQKWFDYVEYKPENHSDVAMAHRFMEHYNSRPKDKPLFYNWMSCSMHVPFDLPKDMGEKPKDIDSAYMRSVVYMDSSLGILMNELERSDRAKNTLLILTGDHSIVSSKQMPTVEKVGQAADAFTWVPLLIVGPGIEPRVDTRPVSQGDIPPSIIGFLDLEVSNHFMGTNLLQCRDSSCSMDLPPVYSLRGGGIGLRTDSLTFLLSNVEGSDPAVVLKKEHEPTWDTSEPVEGYINEEPIEIPQEQLLKTSATMHAVSNAWKYVVYKNKLMPQK